MKLNQSVYYMDNNVIVRDTIISIQTIESVVETKSESVVFYTTSKSGWLPEKLLFKTLEALTKNLIENIN